MEISFSYVEKNINKSIYYLTLAANQNHLNSQTLLGSIYYCDKSIYYYKAIHFFTLAPNQNDVASKYFLGKIFYDKRDFEKAIPYLTNAADKNISNAQYYLGEIFYIKGDINKSIYYFTLAANQNHIPALIGLAYIYISGELIVRDINRSIYYLLMAVKINSREAQYILGKIYYDEFKMFKTHDIKKSIIILILLQLKMIKLLNIALERFITKIVILLEI